MTETLASRLRRQWVTLLLVLMIAAPAWAQIPQSLVYSGRLVDDLGDPLIGPVDLTLGIHDAAIDGNRLYDEDHLGVPLDPDGRFTVELGLGDPGSGGFDAALFSPGSDRWLEVTVDSEILAPRQVFGSVPWAFVAEQSFEAMRLEGLTAVEIMNQATLDLGFSNLAGQIADAQIPDGIARDTELGNLSFGDLAGTASDAQIPSAITRDGEVMSRVLTADGAGSSLDADLLDGLTSSAFALDGEVLGIVRAGDGPGSGVNADLLDGLSSSRFLRSNASDSFTGTRLTIGDELVVGQELRMDGQLFMDGRTSWSPSQDRADQRIYWGNQGNPTQEYLSWDDFQDRFEFSDSVAVASNLVAGGIGSSFSYNRFSVPVSTTPTDPGVNNASDLFIGDNLEVYDDAVVGDDLSVGGTTTTTVLEITGGADLSEGFEIHAGTAGSSGEGVEAGHVVCIDPAHEGSLRVCDAAYDATVAGIVSGAGGVSPGLMMGQSGTIADGAHPVALTGRVYVRISTASGPVVPGALLTTAARPGHAMAVTDFERARGAILGKAMTRPDASGLVLVLVSLQ